MDDQSDLPVITPRFFFNCLLPNNFQKFDPSLIKSTNHVKDEGIFLIEFRGRTLGNFSEIRPEGSK